LDTSVRQTLGALRFAERTSSPARRARGAMNFRTPTCPPGQVQHPVRRLRSIP